MNLNLIFQGYQNLTIRVAIYRSDINCQNLILAHDGQIINTTVGILGKFFWPFSIFVWTVGPLSSMSAGHKCEGNMWSFKRLTTYWRVRLKFKELTWVSVDPGIYLALDTSPVSASVTVSLLPSERIKKLQTSESDILLPCCRYSCFKLSKLGILGENFTGTVF